LHGQIARAGKDRLLAFHVCDWLVPTKDILNDRGMMGDGVIDIKSVRAAVEAQGFAGIPRSRSFPAMVGQADGRGACRPASSGIARWCDQPLLPPRAFARGGEGEKISSGRAHAIRIGALPAGGARPCGSSQLVDISSADKPSAAWSQHR
jgi:hypothetical protein